MVVPPGGGLVSPAPGGPAQPEGKLGWGKEPCCPAGGQAGELSRRRHATQAKSSGTDRTARICDPADDRGAGPMDIDHGDVLAIDHSLRIWFASGMIVAWATASSP